MTNCLNCGKEITLAKGGREKKFCNPTCRYKFFLSKKAAEKSLDNISKSIPELELIKSNEKAVELWKQLKEVLGSPEHQERKMDALRDMGLIGKTKMKVLPLPIEEDEDTPEPFTYNEYLSVIPTFDSIEQCKKLSAYIDTSDFAPWQKVELKKRCVARSQHPDLN